MVGHIYVICGVCGSGKTTLGTALASQLNLPFKDADDLHSDSNRLKMSSGIPLDDGDRAPWLKSCGLWCAAAQGDGGGVLACSALKLRYRNVLRSMMNECVTFILLNAPDTNTTTLIAQRLIARQIEGNHFMPAKLLSSQLAALELPDDTEKDDIIIVDVSLSVTDALTLIQNTPL